MKIVILHPHMRRVSMHASLHRAIEQYIARLESLGQEVFWPLENEPEDSNPILHPCAYPVTVLQQADQVHVWYGNHSHQCIELHTALGIVFALNKDIILINRRGVLPNNGRDDFNNLLLCLDLRTILGRDLFKGMKRLFKNDPLELLAWLYTPNHSRAFKGKCPIVLAHRGGKDIFAEMVYYFESDQPG